MVLQSYFALIHDQVFVAALSVFSRCPMPRLEIEGIVRERFSFPTRLFISSLGGMSNLYLSSQLGFYRTPCMLIGDINEMASPDMVEIAYFTIVVIR